MTKEEEKYISIEELRKRDEKYPANKKFFELLEKHTRNWNEAKTNNPDSKQKYQIEFQKEWNEWVDQIEHKELLELNLSEFCFNLDNEEVIKLMGILVDNKNTNFHAEKKLPELNFEGLCFPQVNFIKSKFYNCHVWFHETQFYKMSEFEGVEFLGDVSFESAQFYWESNFKNVTFNAANFLCARFSEKHQNNGTRYPRKIRFEGATFLSHNVMFECAKFFQEVDFSSTTFKTVTFIQTYFYNGVNFGTENIGKPSKATNFSDEVDFRQAKFYIKRSGCKINFKGVSFPKKVDFRGSHFLNDSFPKRVGKLICRLKDNPQSNILSEIYPDNLSQIYNKAKDSEQELSIDEAMQILSPLLSLLGDSHNQFSFTNNLNSEEQNKKTLKAMEQAISRSDTFTLVAEKNLLNKVNFEEVKFLDEVNFTQAKFSHKTDLTKTIFEDEVKFNDTILDENAQIDFEKALFKGRSFFTDIDYGIGGTINFSHTEFNKSVFFSFKENQENKIILNINTATFLSYVNFNIKDTEIIPDFANANIPNQLNFDLKDKVRAAQDLLKLNVSEENFRFLKKYYKEKLDFEKSHFYFTLGIEKKNQEILKKTYEKAGKQYSSPEEISLNSLKLWQKIRGGFKNILSRWKIVWQCPSLLTDLKIAPDYFYKITSNYGTSIVAPLLCLLWTWVLFGSISSILLKNSSLPDNNIHRIAVVDQGSNIRLIYQNSDSFQKDSSCQYSPFPDSAVRTAGLFSSQIKSDAFNPKCYSRWIMIPQVILSSIFWFLLFLGIRNRYQIK